MARYIVLSKNPAIEIKTVGKAAADIGKHILVTYDASGNIIAADTAGDPVLGSTIEAVETGRPVAVVTRGEAYIYDAAGSLTKGSSLATDASGKAVQASAGDSIVGIVVNDISDNADITSGAADDIIVAHMKISM